VSVRITRAVALRVLGQLRRDPRTIALIVGVPCVLMVLLQQLFGRSSPVFQSVGTPMLGLFPFITMFLVTSVTMNGHGSEDRLTENVTLNFAKFKQEYVPQKPDGSGDAAIEGTFHIAKNLKM